MMKLKQVDLSPRPISVPAVLQFLGGLVVLVVAGMSFLLGRQMSQSKVQYQNQVSGGTGQGTFLRQMALGSEC